MRFFVAGIYLGVHKKFIVYSKDVLIPFIFQSIFLPIMSPANQKTEKGKDETTHDDT